MSSPAYAAVRPVITAWSAVSPFGVGRKFFVDGVLAGQPTAAPLDREQWPGPDEQACLVPDFSVKEVLGRKGTRSMDRVTGLAVSTIGQLLHDADGNRVVRTGEESALVLGTTMGSAQSTMDFVRDSFTGGQPHHVDPARMPNSVMNCAAGQCAIWHQLRGPNTTLAGGGAAGLLSLDYARRLLHHGRAGQALVGAAEEYSTARAWLHRHSGGTTVLGEGCAILLVEPAAAVGEGRRPLAEVLAVQSRFYLDADPRRALAASVRDVLTDAGVRQEEVWAAVGSAVGEPGEHEHAQLRALFGDAAVNRMPGADLLGDTGAASSALRIATVLSVAERSAEAAGKLVVLSAVDPYGTAACALLRLAD
ncbi:beta-ketoacyl synthase N-terminal-like domain-containing protein [Goodfellowiella coeruleoviolacea]|uniref:3-oxoacyl-[acyl-carrier-protein] synthase II n=1 Tax=Goodfellowiella coeruleoviolacea TaxID=334858 RepID=A0AAE3G7L6_9PSEU|nr:beta-ketoacyl synthase N-terminal-like domain-containing protein [Goodfellowiella coeruleoviolacea]MCP2163196.1 3-oxoacyl-[acyl-carrier-protein] synthase II [Goodfellowiella coeruleoviolacea]